MAAQDPQIIDSILDADGDKITLTKTVEIYQNYQFDNRFSGNTETRTHEIERLDISGVSQAHTVVKYDGAVPEASVERKFLVDGSLSRAESGSVFSNFGSDVIVVNGSFKARNSSGHPDDDDLWTQETVSYIVNIDGSDLSGPGTDADWQAVLRTVDGPEYAGSEELSVVRTINGELETVYLLAGELPKNYSENGDVYYFDLEMTPLTDGRIFAAAEVYGDLGSSLIINTVDASGNLTKTEIALDANDKGFQAEIIKDDQGSSYYIAEYDPVTAVHTGSDELQTTVWTIADSEHSQGLTIVGMDLKTNDVTSISAPDAAGVLHMEIQGSTRAFKVDYDAGTLTPIQRIAGTAGNDTIHAGGKVSDKIWAGNGDDHIDAGAGWDTIFGGAGSDEFVLDNSGTTDRIKDFSIAQGDRLDVSSVVGNGTHALILSEIFSGKGDQKGIAITDAVDGHIYADLRGPGLESMDAAEFPDSFAGHLDDAGRRVLWIGEKIASAIGSTSVAGTEDDDIIMGQNTRGLISAGAGDDAVFVSQNNEVYGGEGQDLFVFSSSGRIRDFAAGQDRLDVTGWKIDSFDDLILSERLTGKGAGTGDLIVSNRAGAEAFSIRIDGAWNTGVDADDFLFA